MVKWKSEIIFLILTILSLVNCEETNLRLPRAIFPFHYEIRLETAVHNDGIRDYGGTVIIELYVNESTSQVVLHHRDLSITNVKLYTPLSIEVYTEEHSYNNETEFLTIPTSLPLTAGSKLYLEIHFNGKLQTGTAGFYLSQYQVAGESKPRYLAATQFEPTRARSAFPCFDEPEWRTTFKLYITHGSNYTAISNMVGTSRNNVDSTTTTEFDITPVIMPTYLLAFVVSDLDYINTPEVPLSQRIYATAELVESARSALILSELFLDILGNYANFSYQLPKLDSVAMPDHGSAMENYGLILYKEQYLVIEKVAHPREMYDLVGTITHELTHQLFGNVVTCRWWDQIWLNEGFATWGEFLLPELLNVTLDHQFHHLFNIKKTQNAFRHDSRQSTRPMTFPTNTNAEISARFDNIAYDKSGAVIRMFQYVTGDTSFRSSLYRYLSYNKHTSVTSDELLFAFESVVGSSLGFNFTAAFRSWENQKGFPVINVVYADDQFKITQKRYLSEYEVIEPADESAKWFIPLSFTTAANPDFTNETFTDYFRLEDNEKSISTTSISGFDSSQWYIFNIQQHGYYRVNYDTTNWQNIIKILNSPDYTKIHVLNRAQLVDDALTLAFDGYLSYDIALGVVSYLHREIEYFPWYSATIAFDKIEATLKGTKLHEEFRTFVRFLIQKMYQYYGEDYVSTDDIIRHFTRELAIEWACRMGDKHCLEGSVQHLEAGVIEPPLQIVYYCNGLKESDNIDLFNGLVGKMHNASFQNERLRILDGLLCSKNAGALKEFLASMLEPEVTFFRTHERRRAFNSLVTRNEIGLEILVDFIKGNYEKLKTTMTVSFIEGLFVAASARIVDSADEMLLLELIFIHRSEMSEKTLTDVTRNIENNKKWVQSDKFLVLQSKVKQFNQETWRLPKTSIPSQYDIHLDARDVHIGALPYRGEVKIDAEIMEVTDNIVIHSKNQEFQEFVVTDLTSSLIIPITLCVFRIETDQVTIFFDQTLAVGTKVQIHAKYSTELLTEIDGLYQDSYIDSDGFTKKYLATTQFQAVEARRVFPSYDEPALKAVFKVSITHDASYHAVANMPVTGMPRNNFDGTLTTHFDPTPPMSSYLNAFLVSDFDVLTNALTKKENETLQGIYMRPGQSQKARYGLDNSVKILNALQDLVGVKFNLPKLDSGAIPGKGGGMENWGLVLYREAALLYDEDISHSLMQRGVRLISHEIVHMFFGDLVTGEWWNYLWLNEGFATDLMYSILDDLYPDWHMKEFFSRNIMIPYAFVTDASSSTRSMSSELITTSDINNSFDDIAYDKAACVLRMVGYLLGKDLWKKGLNLYLETNKYKAVNSQDFVDAIVTTLNDAGMSEIPFDLAFRSWENQEGYPLVHAVYDSQRQSFVLTQERFFDKKKTDGIDKSMWYISVNYATQEDYDFEDLTVTYIMKAFVNETLIPITGYNSSQWLLLNKQQIGYYRVMYEPANYKALTDFLHTEDFEEIHVVNRMHLLDDTFALAHGGYLDYQVPYDIITYLINDKNFFTWDIFMDNINRLYEVYGSRDESLNWLVKSLSKNFYAQYKLQGTSIPNEIMPVRYGRELAYFIACNAGNEDCLADTKVLGKLDATGAKAIPRGLEDPILCNYFKQSSIQVEWMSVWNRMNNLQQNVDYTFKTNLINALACTNNKELLYDHLERSLESAFNYTQSDRRNVFNAVLKNENGLETVLRLLDNHGQSNLPVERFGWSWQRILMNIADAIYTEEEKTKYLEFLNNFAHEDVTTDLLERTRDASTGNLDAQKLPENIRQMQLIWEIIERLFAEPTTTEPGSATAVHVSIFLVTIVTAIVLRF